LFSVCAPDVISLLLVLNGNKKAVQSQRNRAMQRVFVYTQ